MGSNTEAMHPDHDGKSSADDQTSLKSMAVFRRIMPAVTADGGSSQGTLTPTERSAKYPRHQVPAACLQCRKRKVKVKSYVVQKL